MPVGDFPTVFPTIMTCRLNRMVTSKNGNIHRRYCIFLYSVIFFDHGFSFADHEDVFFANTCIFCIFKLTMRCCIFLHIMTLFIVHGKICLQFTCTIYIEDTGRSKMRQEFWSFRGFRTK